MAERYPSHMDRAVPRLPFAWWIEPGRLLGGGYPGHGRPDVAERQLGALLDVGISRVLDLMEEDPRGAPPYEPTLSELAARRNRRIEVRRVPIEDHEVTDAAALVQLEVWLDALQHCSAIGYLPGWGGRGRTGVAAGVYRIRHRGAAAADVLPWIAGARAGLPGDSPESDEQRRFLLEYAARRRSADPR